MRVVCFLTGLQFTTESSDWGFQGIVLSDALAVGNNVSDTRCFQIRWETCNITDHLNYDNPDTNLENSDFGRLRV
jgi:hypothetical protein